MQRHLHVNLLVLIDALEVDVQHQRPERMHLHIAQQHLLFRALVRHIEYRRMKRFELQVPVQRMMIHFDRLRRFIRAIDDARHLARAAQTAARTRALRCTRKRRKFNFHYNLHKLDRPRPDDPFLKNSNRYKVTASFPQLHVRPHFTLPLHSQIYSTNKELTESSLLMRNIVSASRPAIDNTRIRPHFAPSSLNGMVSVTTISSSAEFAM